ncbi:C-type lectin domain family 4 member M CD209 antigen-like protein 1 [Collichthys lucidus]|uniref:C-type lectin domain family 4 member M CD209 antigen-like protein 1 n=1 Tax=Collichthys lucidus TaxID=240159 RepID=A0A4V6XYG1_COLLU|nr:C-type lectin domain family 4 member M CD209 antigen-like protein 1 [Collichthys lucidus]
MVKFVHKEESEITMDYVNLPALPEADALKSCSGKDGGVTPAVPGMKVYRLVAVSFGLLCILQGALNISLRLALDKEASCNNLTKETAELRGKLSNFHYYFKQGWVYFHPSFYYISSVMKSWNDSRNDCLQRGADLMIINSKEEQKLYRAQHNMDELAIYVNVERPAGHSSTREREMQSSEKIYENMFLNTLERNITGPAFSVTRSNSEWKMEMALLHNNLTGEKEQYQSSYNNLTEKKEDLQANYNILRKENEQFQSSYYNLTEQKERLQTNYNRLRREKEQLQSHYDDLTKKGKQLQTEKDQLQKKLEALTKEKNDLQKNIGKEDHYLNQGWVYFGSSFYYISSGNKTWQDSREDCLQRGADLAIINSEAEQLFRFGFSFWRSGEPNNYRGRNEDCVELANNWNDVECEHDSDDNTTDPVAALRKVTKERDELNKKLTIFTEYSRQGWMYFNNSFYYISTLKKTWQDSRSDCQQRGADLMIINSIEEQNFTRRFCTHMWIGLTDQEKEGTWKWVDGTLLTTSYWGINEPNSHEGMDEDCGEIKFYDDLNSWNDKPCQTKNTWMCEKTMVL